MADRVVLEMNVAEALHHLQADGAIQRGAVAGTLRDCWSYVERLERSQKWLSEVGPPDHPDDERHWAMAYVRARGRAERAEAALAEARRERDDTIRALQVSDSALRRTARELVEARAELAEARRKALEEAAKTAEDENNFRRNMVGYEHNVARKIAAAIRALIPADKPEQRDRVHPTKGCT